MMTIKIALYSLSRNKMRAFLTILGIVFGVGSVIAMINMGKGAQQSVQERIQSMGPNNLTVFARSSTRGGVHQSSTMDSRLDYDDVDAIGKECPHVEYVSPSMRTTVRTIYKNQNWSTALNGGNAQYQYIRGWKMEKGVFFSEEDVRSAVKVCVLGSIVVDNLFGTEEPLGKTIRINKIPFKVIGVLETKGGTGFGGNLDDCIVIPYTTMNQRITKSNRLRVIMATATASEDCDRAEDEITDLLRQRHRLKSGDENDFEIRNQAEVSESVGQTTQVFTIFLASIAGVALLVGGINIMNIMMVSVTERIQEIGIRMAIGAKQRDILLQFLIESVVLCSLGGFIGIGLGVLASHLIAQWAKWPMVFSPEAVLLSFSFAFGVGVFFGFYPAYKASRLDPIQALRNE